jgi:NAD(P)-dependent dehydrogenase (short-subunit alcohol dehydrogenase family)
LDFTGRTIVVAGGATGIGRATVELLGQRGAQVAIIDRNLARAQEVADLAGGRAYLADVSDEAQVVAAFATIDRDFGPLHGLYSNAGIIRVEGSIHEETVEAWDAIISVNLRGTFLTVREAIKRFVAQLAIPGDGSAYTASKGGIEALVRQVAVDYARLRIRINAVAPGAIETPLMWETTPAAEVDAMRRVIDGQVPLGRIGLPIDIAHCVAWLLSDEAAYVTGATVLVDGGVGAKMVLSV